MRRRDLGEEREAEIQEGRQDDAVRMIKFV